MPMLNFWKLAVIAIVSSLLLQCTHIPPAPKESFERSISAVSDESGLAVNQIGSDWLEATPGNSKDFYDQIQRSIFWNKKNKLTPEQLQIASKRIARYASFVMYNYPSSVEKKKVADKFISRLFQSSTQFLLCRNLLDYNCIEQAPYIVPTSDFRIEDPSLKLGEVVKINDSLDENLEWYFNEQIFVPEEEYHAETSIAKILEDKIRGISDSKENSIFMALYGVDDVFKNSKTTGSLAGVYDALLEKVNSKTSVYGVFDIKGIQTDAPRPLIMTYVKPKNPNEQKNWILAPYSAPSDPPLPQTSPAAKLDKKEFFKLKAKMAAALIEKTNLDFQYNEGTQGLIQSMNENIKDESEARARLEWKNNGIMHNKFFIFKERDNWSVWTGTANISRTCMGTERNSNLSIYIKNNEIAKSYLDEFTEMFTFQDPTPENTELNPALIGPSEDKKFPYGKFHTAKRPNTKRLFYFEKDKSYARVYFSPTDDAEHRAIIPLLLSAKPGDKILISMFGGAGIEYARALQFAAARGVDVKVIVDSPTSCGAGAWAGRSGDATLLEKNPYRLHFAKTLKPIEVRKNDRSAKTFWKQNHQKVGLLLRKQKNGRHLPTDLIVGSQNWSSSGNDINDENLIAFTNTTQGLTIGSDFEKHFENFLWPKALVVGESGCVEPAEVKAELPPDEPID